MMAAVTDPVRLEDAERVLRRLVAELGEPDWLQGVGIDLDPVEGFAVSVRVLPGGPEPKLAERIDGVAVRVCRRDIARAFTG